MNQDIINLITIGISSASIIFAFFSLIISYLTYKGDKPNIKLEYSIIEVLGGAGLGKIYDGFKVTVKNVGKRQITIENFSIEQIKSKNKFLNFFNIGIKNYLWFGVGASTFIKNPMPFILKEYSSNDIIVNLLAFKHMENNILGLKKIIISDSIGNKYKLKLKNKDLKIIRKIINSVKI